MSARMEIWSEIEDVQGKIDDLQKKKAMLAGLLSYAECYTCGESLTHLEAAMKAKEEATPGHEYAVCPACVEKAKES